MNLFEEIGRQFDIDLAKSFENVQDLILGVGDGGVNALDFQMQVITQEHFSEKFAVKTSRHLHVHEVHAPVERREPVDEFFEVPFQVLKSAAVPASRAAERLAVELPDRLAHLGKFLHLRAQLQVQSAVKMGQPA